MNSFTSGEGIMNFADFVEGPLLWATFIILIAAVAARLCFFILKMITGRKPGKDGSIYRLASVGRSLVPFHMGVLKKPGYAALRYLFHLCLFVVPIWLGGHIVLWSESRLGWDWAAIPDSWADWMTLLVIAIALFFLLRRIAFPQLRPQSSARDYLIVIFTALPFASGYFLTHGTLDAIKFFSDNMRMIHVLSGEVMVLMAAFLFCRTRMNTASCTGCASCELSCPTGTLESRDESGWRIFTYSHYQCICCGACVGTCPENAADLRHEVSLVKFFQALPKLEIRRAEMKVCRQCGGFFVPEPLFTKINRSFEDDYLLSCPVCRKTNVAGVFMNLSPKHKAKSKDAIPVPTSIRAPFSKRAA
jgi:ferredoxin